MPQYHFPQSELDALGANFREPFPEARLTDRDWFDGYTILDRRGGEVFLRGRDLAYVVVAVKDGLAVDYRLVQGAEAEALNLRLAFRIPPDLAARVREALALGTVAEPALKRLFGPTLHGARLMATWKEGVNERRFYRMLDAGLLELALGPDGRVVGLDLLEGPDAFARIRHAIDVAAAAAKGAPAPKAAPPPTRPAPPTTQAATATPAATPPEAPPPEARPPEGPRAELRCPHCRRAHAVPEAELRAGTARVRCEGCSALWEATWPAGAPRPGPARLVAAVPEEVASAAAPPPAATPPPPATPAHPPGSAEELAAQVAALNVAIREGAPHEALLAACFPPGSLAEGDPALEAALAGLFGPERAAFAAERYRFLLGTEALDLPRLLKAQGRAAEPQAKVAQGGLLQRVFGMKGVDVVGHVAIGEARSVGIWARGPSSWWLVGEPSRLISPPADADGLRKSVATAFEQAQKATDPGSAAHMRSLVHAWGTIPGDWLRERLGPEVGAAVEAELRARAPLALQVWLPRFAEAGEARPEIQVRIVDPAAPGEDAALVEALRSPVPLLRARLVHASGAWETGPWVFAAGGWRELGPTRALAGRATPSAPAGGQPATPDGLRAVGRALVDAVLARDPDRFAALLDDCRLPAPEAALKPHFADLAAPMAQAYDAMWDEAREHLAGRVALATRARLGGAVGVEAALFATPEEIQGTFGVDHPKAPGGLALGALRIGEDVWAHWMHAGGKWRYALALHALAPSPGGMLGLTRELQLVRWLLASPHEVERRRRVASLVLPEPAAWFGARFGERVGATLAARYAEDHGGLEGLLHALASAGSAPSTLPKGGGDPQGADLLPDQRAALLRMSSRANLFWMDVGGAKRGSFVSDGGAWRWIGPLGDLPPAEPPPIDAGERPWRAVLLVGHIADLQIFSAAATRLRGRPWPAPPGGAPRRSFRGLSWFALRGEASDVAFVAWPQEEGATALANAPLQVLAMLEPCALVQVIGSTMTEPGGWRAHGPSYTSQELVSTSAAHRDLPRLCFGWGGAAPEVYRANLPPGSAPDTPLFLGRDADGTDALPALLAAIEQRPTLRLRSAHLAHLAAYGEGGTGAWEALALPIPPARSLEQRTGRAVAEPPGRVFRRIDLELRLGTPQGLSPSAMPKTWFFEIPAARDTESGWTELLHRMFYDANQRMRSRQPDDPSWLQLAGFRVAPVDVATMLAWDGVATTEKATTHLPWIVSHQKVVWEGAASFFVDDGGRYDGMSPYDYSELLLYRAMDAGTVDEGAARAFLNKLYARGSGDAVFADRAARMANLVTARPSSEYRKAPGQPPFVSWGG